MLSFLCRNDDLRAMREHQSRDAPLIPDEKRVNLWSKVAGCNATARNGRIAASENEAMNWGLGEKRVPQRVTNGRLEIEREGAIAYLEYSVSGDILELAHTEVPEKLRRKGLAAQLAQAALDWAREQKLKVDVVCPIVQDFIKKHPEYADLVMH